MTAGLVAAIVGAVLALVAQVVLQLVVVPRVERRKRRDDRWERNVLTLGELLTTELPSRARSAEVDQAVMFAVLAQSVLAGGEEDAIATLPHDMQDECRASTQQYTDLAVTRVQWLGHLVASAPLKRETIRTFDRVLLAFLTSARLTTTFRFPSVTVTESEVRSYWERERQARANLVTAVMAMLPSSGD